MSYGVGLRNGVAFALGTIPSLTSGGGLRPSLMLDFLSGSLDPRITFSRGTQAMQYGSDGTLQYAPNNLLTYSNQADNAAWTKSNSFVQTNLLTFSDAAVANYTGISAQVVNTSPISGFTNSVAFPYTPATNIIAYKSYTTVAGIIYTISAYVQMDDGGVPVVTTSPTAGDFTLVTENNPTPTNITVTSVGGGVYRVYASITALGGGTNTGVVKYNTQSARGFKVTGLQLVQGSVPGDYVATTSAALPCLYADYNGALRARKLCEDAANNYHICTQNITGISGVIYTASYRLKQGERQFAQISVDGNDGNGAYANINLATGVVTQSAAIGTGTLISTSIVSAGNGYWQVAISASRVAVTAVRAYVGVIPTGTTSWATFTVGDGSSGIYIADAQLTPGYLPLAVTETTSAAVYGPRFDYDPSSLVAQNLLTYSQNLALYWVYGTGVTLNPTSIIAPDGTLTARTVNYSAGGGTEFLRNSTSAIAASVAQTFSFWAKSISGNTSFSIDLQNIEGTTVTLTSEWQRFTWTVTPAAARTWVDFQLGAAGTVALWGVQLNTGSTALPYTATTTAPYTLTTARGLLIEEQRTNLLLQSNDFQTSWTPTNITRTLNSTLSPEGVVNGVKIEATAAAATALYQQITSTSTSHTFSVYVKQGTGATTANNFIVRNITTLTNLLQVTLNYSTGVVTYVTGSTGASAVSVGNGWWRLQLSVTAGITVGDLVAGYVGFTGGVFTAGDFLYAYGAQLEAGAFATSYIPTLGSTATRNADSATIPAGTWYNTAAGTWYFNGETQTFPRYLIVDNSGAAKYPMYVHSAAGGIGNFDGTNLTLTGNNTTARTTFKAATTYSGSVATAVLNGGTVATGTYNGAFSTIATFKLGGATGAGGEIDGHIQSIRFYPTALSSVSQQSITV